MRGQYQLVRRVEASLTRNSGPVDVFRYFPIHSLLVAAALCLPGILPAQGVRVSGSVVRERDGARVPVPAAVVVLHRIGAAGEGPVDSARTTAQGNYRFFRPEADSSAQLFASVRHDGVAYVSGEPERHAGAVRIPPITVFDTSSTSGVEVSQRHLLVRGPERDGSRAVLDLIILRNLTDRTRVAAGDGPTWLGRLIVGSVDAIFPTGDASAEAVRIRGDTLSVSAPIPPGDRQIAISYVLPATRRLTLPLDAPVRTLVLMLADTTAAVAHGGVESLGIREFEQERYIRFEGLDTPGGDSVVIALPDRPVAAADLWWLVVVASAGVLAAAAAKWWRAPLADRAGSS